MGLWFDAYAHVERGTRRYSSDLYYPRLFSEVDADEKSKVCTPRRGAAVVGLPPRLHRRRRRHHHHRRTATPLTGLVYVSDSGPSERWQARQQSSVRRRTVPSVCARSFACSLTAWSVNCQTCSAGLGGRKTNCKLLEILEGFGSFNALVKCFLSSESDL